MKAYLDNASTGFPKNPACLTAMEEAFRVCANSGRSIYEYADNASLTLYRAREALAQLFDAQPENVVLAMNTTHALNMAIKGLYRGGSIVISDLEHNAVMRPSYACGAKLKIFHVSLCDDAETVNNFKRLMGQDVGLAAVTFASNVCGRILPIKEICRVAAEHGVPIVIDAAQVAGHFKISLRELGCTALCLPCHKGLYAPTGTGALIMQEDARQLKTIIEGGTGSSPLSTDMPPLLPERMEAGTQNICMAAAIAAACENFTYPEGIGKLFEYLTNEMKGDKRFVLYGAPNGNFDKYGPVLAFNQIGMPSEQYAEAMAQRGIAVRGGYHCSMLAHRALRTGGGCVRISLGRNNTLADIDAFLAERYV